MVQVVPDRQTDVQTSVAHYDSLTTLLITARASLKVPLYYAWKNRSFMTMRLRGWSNIQQQYLIDHTQLRHRPSVRGGGGIGGRYLQLIHGTEAQFLTEYQQISIKV